MQTVSDLYQDVAIVYTRLVRQENLEAADTIDQINASYGSHAALRAALIVTIAKMEVQQNHWIPNASLYTHLLEAYPEAVPLMKHALACCLHGWGASMVESQDWVALASA